MNNNVVLKAVGLQKSYKEGGRLLHVLKDVNLEVHEGESVRKNNAPAVHRRSGPF